MNPLTYLSAFEMAQMIREKKISPIELLQAHLQRIEQANPQLNAIVSLDAERCLQEARIAEAAVMRGAVRGPLHGVPITIKSSIDVAGFRCETGTKLRTGYIAEADAPLVTRLRAAGAIVLGTTNVPEMLMAYETDNLIYGQTKNPWDFTRTPGGSSGGEAAAIASGCSAAGVGSDGGGSIRVPAHFSGICGLKPTPGRIPATGHFPASLGPFAQLGVVGPMARRVRDLQVLFEVMAGADDRDVRAAPVPLRRLTEEDIRRIHVGYFDDDPRTPVTPEIRSAVGMAAESLRRAGFEVSHYLPEGLAEAHRLWWMFFGLMGGMLLRPLVADREGDLHPILKEFLDVVADAPTAEQVVTAWLERDQIRLRILAEMGKFPILICPVCSVSAFRHGEGTWRLDGQGVRYREAMAYSQWFNLLGHPAAVVPMSRSPEGLPIGVQIVGRPYEEEAVLAVAAKIEEQCGGWQEPPFRMQVNQ